MPAEPRVDRNSSGQSEFRSGDRLIAELANRQHGMVSRDQLLSAGFSDDLVDYKVKLQRLNPVHRGVYAVGHRQLTREGRWMAAVLAVNGVLSHRSAAALWGFWFSEAIEVTASGNHSRPGIRVHTSRLPPDEVTAVRAIPVTGLSRTLLDLATVLPPHQLERAINEAEMQNLSDSLSLPELIDRYPGRRGIAAIKAVLDTGPAFTRSELEARFLALVRTARLPSPLVNALILNHECDFAWPDHGLIAELDGAAHRTAAAFERDRARDRTLQLHGWRVIRVTWRQLHGDAEAVFADLRELLGATAPRHARARAGAP